MGCPFSAGAKTTALYVLGNLFAFNFNNTVSDFDWSISMMLRNGVPTMRPLLAAFFLFVFVDSAGAQFANFQDVDKVVSADMLTFQSIFRSASSDTVTIAMFGDSQETVPNAGGVDYVPAINFEFNQHFGNTPVSGIAFADSYDSRWLLAGGQNGVIDPSGKNRDSQLLPSQAIGRFDNSRSAGGLLAQLNLDADATTPNFNAPGLEFGRNVRVEVTVRDSIGSGEVDWRVNLQDGDGRNFFGGENIATGVTNLGLGASAGNYLTADLGVFQIPEDHNAVQVIARGADANGVEIAGIRFINEDNPAGIAVESFSAGGYRAYRIEQDHGDAAQALLGIANHDVLALHFGANDSVDRSAVEYREDLVSLIETFREWSGDEEKPIIIFTDADHDTGNSLFRREQFDQFAGVAADVALSLDNVLAVNSRLLAHEIGWRADGDLLDYAGDGVHYTTFGAQTLAEVEVAALVEALSVPEPSSGIILFAGLSLLCLSRRRTLNV